MGMMRFRKRQMLTEFTIHKISEAISSSVSVRCGLFQALGC